MPADHRECWHHGRPHPVRHHGPPCPLALLDPGLRSTDLSLYPHWLLPCTRARGSAQLGHQPSHWDSLWPPEAHLPS